MRGMNPRVIVLAFCLAGNALLAFALLRHTAPAAPRPASASGNIPTASQNPAAPAVAAEDAALTDLLNETNGIDFSWSRFTLADYARYIKELRAFGTPEARVREIILGAIEASYRPKRAALIPPKKPDDGKFWARRNFYGFQSQQTKEQRVQMRALRKEESELV